MAMDNPSYFTVPSEESPKRERTRAFRPRTLKISTSSSTDGASPLSPPSSLGNSESFSKITNFDPNSTEPPVYSDVLSKNHYLVPNGCQSPRGQSTRRSFRSLLRSLSANAACPQDAQAILQGEPRPSDIAPADHCALFSVRSHRRFAHARNASEFRHVIKKKSHDENEEVFYTMPLAGNGRRRHSIGAYLTRDRSTKNLLKVTTVPSEVPQEIAPKITTDGSPVCSTNSIKRITKKTHHITTLHCSDSPVPIGSISTCPSQKKKRVRCPSMKEMENIIIISSRESPEAGLWVEYLITCFNKMMSERARQHYKIVHLHVEDVTDSIPENPKVKQLAKAKLQLIIVCPKLLLHVEHLPTEALNSLSVLQDDKVLAMFLGVDDQSITDAHKRAFQSYEQWKRMVMKEQDSAFVDNFLGIAVDILSKKFRNPSENANFSIIPKKIKPGQNRVIALLNEPLTNQDAIAVYVEKKGELLQIKTFKRRNPYTLQFDVPDCCLEVSMLIWIKIEKNGIPCGSRQIKCESRLRELDQILRASDNPLEFMCQTLGFKTTDKDQLDSWMLTAFQKNIPPHFNLLSSPLQANNKVNSTSVDEYPTLLHFAARFGLERLCWQLLECPGGETACDTRNVRHLTPADLAQAHGFPEIATVLRGFMQMSEFSNMYYYLKNMSEESQDGHEKKINNISFQRERSISSLKTSDPITPEPNPTDLFSEECLHRLELKHSNLKTIKPTNQIPELLYENDICHNHSIQNDTNIQRAIEHDYLIQPSNRKVENEIVAASRPKQIDLDFTNKNIITDFLSPTSKSRKAFSNNDFFEGRNNFNIVTRSNSTTPTSSTPAHDNHQAMTPSGQDELAEIIKDFKNNVFTISEVEKLVLDWRNRNETQQSLKEKQEQLNKMREEYDKLQRRIKDDMKRPTPFERVRKMFSKSKQKGGKNAGSESTSSNQRPNSGLSVHSVSSSSSGRLSTASGVSMGESGTQSDNEDIKMFTRITGMQDSSNKPTNDNHDFDNYLIPPPPRPLEENRFALHSPSNVNHMRDFRIPHHMDTINEREVKAFHEPNNDAKVCSPVIPKSQFNGVNNTVEHNYINMSPA